MSNSYNNIMIFLSMKSPCTFLLAKEKPENVLFTLIDLSQNRTEKQIMPWKTTVNWLFNDIWCYLVIGYFDSKKGVFKHTVVRICYILKGKTATSRYFVKKVFLKILKVSQENDCLGVSFHKAEGLRVCNFIKKRLQSIYFPVKFAKIIFEKHLWKPLPFVGTLQKYHTLTAETLESLKVFFTNKIDTNTNFL